MSPKRRRSVNEFDQYVPAAADSRRAEPENVNAFTFDKEFEMPQGESFDGLVVVENVKAVQILPDPLQPRPSPLPEPVLVRFRRGDLDAFQAAREWQRLAEKDPIVRYDIERYVNMGENMAANGQINPITGRWEKVAARGKEREVFRIETGEQRFWSAVVYHVAQKRDPQDLELRVSVVSEAIAPTEMETIKRQISENRKNMQVTEVLQAREIARLLLAAVSEKTGQVFPADDGDVYAYFRNVLQMGRVPHGVWDIVQAEFGLGQHRMRQSLEILHFPSHLLDLAHKTRLSYRTLSQILKLPEEEWEAAVWDAAQAAIAQDPESADMEETSAEDETPGLQPRKLKKPMDPVELASRGIRRFYRSAIKGIHANPLLIQAVADNVIMDGYAEEAIDFMEELVRAIRMRKEEELGF